MHHFAVAINYESASFWVALASFAVALIVSVVSLYLSQASVRISESSLKLMKELAERDLRDWTQRKWFDLYVAAEDFRTQLERFQTLYDKPLATLEFENAVNDLTYKARKTIFYASVFPQNPTVNAFFSCINKWKLDENLFSKEMAAEYDDAIEGFRQQAKVPAEVIQKPDRDVDQPASLAVKNRVTWAITLVLGALIVVMFGYLEAHKPKRVFLTRSVRYKSEVGVEGRDDILENDTANAEFFFLHPGNPACLTLTHDRKRADYIVDIAVSRYPAPSISDNFGDATLTIAEQNGDVILLESFFQNRNSKDDITQRPIARIWEVFCPR